MAGIAASIGWALGGFVLTTFIEYIHHRHAGHLKWFGAGMYQSHQYHHRDPMEGGVSFPEKVRQRLPLVLSLAFFIGVIGTLFRPLLPDVAALVSGSLFGAWYSEWFHHQMHHRAPSNAVEEYLWRHHYIHHWHDPRVNYGFTSPLWDFAFGTVSLDATVTVPKSKVPLPWPDIPSIKLRE